MDCSIFPIHFDEKQTDSEICDPTNQEVIGDLEGDEDLYEPGESILVAGELGSEVFGEAGTDVKSNNKHAACALRYVGSVG